MYKEKWSLWVHYDKKRAKRAKLCPLYRVKNLNLPGADFFNCGWWIWCVWTALCALWVVHCNFMEGTCQRVRVGGNLGQVSSGESEQSPVAKAKGIYRILSSSYWQLSWCYQSPARWSYRGETWLSIFWDPKFFFLTRGDLGPGGTELGPWMGMGVGWWVCYSFRWHHTCLHVQMAVTSFPEEGCYIDNNVMWTLEESCCLGILGECIQWEIVPSMKNNPPGAMGGSMDVTVSWCKGNFFSVFSTTRWI